MFSVESAAPRRRHAGIGKLRSIAFLICAGGAIAALGGTAGAATPIQRAATSDAPHLGNHAEGSSGARSDSGEVRVRHRLRSGNVSVTLYTPAPGVSPQKLANALIKQGLPARVVPAPTQTDSAVARAPIPTPCYQYASARSLQNKCSPYIRWNRNGYLNPYIYFRDLTGVAWPVGRAVTKWNESPYIAPRYTTGACPASGMHCVTVTSRYLEPQSDGTNAWTAQTTIPYNATSRYFIDGGVNITMNDYYASTLTEYQRQGTACHEIGHAVGLDHNLSQGSCLYYQNTTSRTNYPSSDDYNLIRYKIYPR